MAHDQLEYLEKLHHHGFRMTRQRQLILDAVCMGQGHTTVGDIYRRAKSLDSSINRSTIYRALDLFVRLDMVVMAEQENGERSYEVAQAEQHHHLVCKMCRAEIDIDNEIVNDFYKQLQTVYGYQVAMNHLIVAGLCSACAR